MNWDKFKSKFHPSWHYKMQPFIESKACDDIFAFLKKEAASGKKIAPESNNTFRAFYETPYDKMYGVIIGQCPYHSMVGDKIVADGLAFSCGITKKIQPSLDMFFEAIEKELYNGLNLTVFKEEDLGYLAKQGILLLNADLTTEVGVADAHKGLWEPLMQYLMKDCFAVSRVPILFCGKNAEELKYYLPNDYPYYTVEHPSYAARQMRPWNTDGAFTYLDKKIKDMNGVEIQWMIDVPF